jgi:hypothetical protein
VADLTVADLAVRIGAIERTMAELVAALGASMAVTERVLARVAESSHLSVAEVARMMDCSEKTVRRKIAAGAYTLECIPGTRKSGIPVHQIRAGWVKAEPVRAAEKRERQESHRK